jgi:hypothetical protein
MGQTKPKVKPATIAERLAALAAELEEAQTAAEKECDGWRVEGAQAAFSAAETAAEIEDAYSKKFAAMQRRVATIRSLLGA